MTSTSKQLPGKWVSFKSFNCIIFYKNFFCRCWKATHLWVSYYWWHLATQKKFPLFYTLPWKIAYVYFDLKWGVFQLGQCYGSLGSNEQNKQKFLSLAWTLTSPLVNGGIGGKHETFIKKIYGSQILQKESLNEDLPAKILQVEQAMCSFTELAPVGQQQTVGSLLSESQSSSKSLSSQGDSIKSGNTCRDRNGKNSLAQLCRRFLMVLLCNPKDKRRVSLDVASTVLIKDPESEGFDPPSRSRCRRLYDIANVLVAMGLIRKVHYLFGTKKIPLFVYCGPEPNGESLRIMP